MNPDEATIRLLDAAESQFYERGIQAVGMDAIRAHSGVSLKRLYQCFPSKDHLVRAYLRRRDERWRRELADYVDSHATTPEQAPLVVFDWLYEWFRRPDFRGCAFVNSFGELGTVSATVASAARAHKDAVRAYLRRLVEALDVADPGLLTEQLFTLVEGATVVAAMSGAADVARTSRATAETMLRAATRG